MNQFVESLKRLYKRHMIDENKIIELCTNGKISEDEKNHILSTN